MPEVSVILPTHNDGHFLADAIDSVLTQTYSDFELIIVNDGSTDAITPGIIARYAAQDSRIIPIHNPQKLGSGMARRIAIAHATGSLLAMMDGDDISLPTRLEKQIAYLETHPDVGIVSAYCRVQTKYRETFIENFCPSTLDGALRWLLLFNFVFINGSTVVRKPLHLKVDTQKEPMMRSEDLDLLGRMARRTHFGVVPELLYIYRIDDSRPASFYDDSSRFAFRAHQNYIESLLGEGVESDVLQVLMKTNHPHYAHFDDSDLQLLTDAQTHLFRLKDRFTSLNELSTSEMHAINQDLVARSLLIHTYFSDLHQPVTATASLRSVRATFQKVMDRDDLPQSVQNELYQTYWRHAVGNRFWRIPYTLFHPRSAFEINRKRRHRGEKRS